MHLQQNKVRPLDITIEDVAQLGFIVSAVGPPERTQIHAVADPEILERLQQLFINRIWQANFGSDVVIKILQHIQSVMPFRCGGQS